MQKFFVIVLLIAVTRGSVCADEKPAAIPVVKTWRQLRAAPIVAKGDFGVVRAGLENMESPKFGGVLIYVLVQRNEKSKVTTRFGHDEVLGPLDCRVYKKHAPNLVRSKMAAEIVPQHGEAKELLYTRAVCIDTAGEFVVQLSLDDEQTLAQATIKGTNDEFHAWTPLSQSAGQRTLAARRDTDDYNAYLSTKPRGPALPTHEGMSPVDWVGAQRRKARDERLPTLIPSQTSATLRLKGDAKELLLVSDTEMIVARPDWHYLARWWVNDKPFIPKPVQQLAEQNGMITSGRRVRVTLDFDPADLGAKSGDKIGLQLLHLPSGWRTVDSYGVEHLLSAEEGPTVSRLTNRIEFTAP